MLAAGAGSSEHICQGEHGQEGETLQLFFFLMVHALWANQGIWEDRCFPCMFDLDYFKLLMT